MSEIAMNMTDFLLEKNKNYMNNVSLTFGKRKVTYEELHTRIDEYARALYKRGVRENDYIVLAIANTPESVFLLYALNKLGAIICPVFAIQNHYKMYEELSIVKPKMFIGINDSYSSYKKGIKNTPLENIDTILLSPVASIDNQIIKQIYNINQFIKGNYSLGKNTNMNGIIKKGKNFDGAIFPEYVNDKTSHIMFTGGSSGVHKGVELSSNGLNDLVTGVSEFSTVEPGETFMGNLPFNLTFGCLALHTGLCNNLNVSLTLRAMPKDFLSELKRINPSVVYAGPIHYQYLINEIINKMNDNRVNKIDFSNRNTDKTVDEYLDIITDALNKSNLNCYDFSNLKCAVSGGEQLTYFAEQASNIVLHHFGYNDNLWNGLGMTEMWGTVSLKRGKLDADGSIGKVVPGTKYKIIDPITKVEVEQGKAGMLCVSGSAAMRGYFNNPEETKNTIVDGFIVTGDIVKETSNNELFYIDRMKRQFVCGIENIYPQQIENIISEFPEVIECVVTKIADSDLQFTPKCHIYLRNDIVDNNTLEVLINKRISELLGEAFMIRYFEYHRNSLPRTANSKLDYKSLQDSDDCENQKKFVKKSTI